MEDSSPASFPSYRSRKPWTVAVYMVADGRAGGNDLDQVAIREMGEIVRAAAARRRSGQLVDDVHVAIQLDLSGVNGTLRMLVGRDGQVEGHSTTREVNSANSASLMDFFKWVTDHCESDHYLLLFWGHSSGPVVFVGDYEVPGALEASRADSGEAARGSQPGAGLGIGDLAAATKLAVEQRRRDAERGGRPGVIESLGLAFREKGLACFNNRTIPESAKVSRRPAIDILLFKECFMSTLEAAFEVDEVRFMIASQGRVPRLGWPYERILRALSEAGDNVEQAAKGVLESLGAYYEHAQNRRGKDEVPYSLIDVQGIRTTVTPLVRSLVRELGDQPGDLRSEAAARREFVQSALDRSAIGDPALIDVKRLCEKLALVDGTPDNELQAVSVSLLTVLSGPNAPVHTARPNSAFGGVSLFYFPRGAVGALGPTHSGGSFIAPVVAKHRTRYSKLRFGQAEHTGWNAVALAHMANWNTDILQSLQGGAMRDFASLERLSSAAALGVVFGREVDLEQILGLGVDLEFHKPFDFRKPFDFTKPFDFVKPFDFAKLMDLAKSLDLEKAVDFAHGPS